MALTLHGLLLTYDMYDRWLSLCELGVHGPMICKEFRAQKDVSWSEGGGGSL
jgi:hypothetical protein